jgi:hypothetical protein
MPTVLLQILASLCSIRIGGNRCGSWCLAVASSLAIFGAGALAAELACTCGPDFCQSDPRVEGAFVAKRKSLAEEGFPERLLALFDRSPRCVAAAERAPDSFSLMRVAPNGVKDVRGWTADDEAKARIDVVNGTIKSFHVMHVRRTFACCGDADYSLRSDYDPALDLNTAAALNCKKAGATATCN